MMRGIKPMGRDLRAAREVRVNMAQINQFPAPPSCSRNEGTPGIAAFSAPARTLALVAAGRHSPPGATQSYVRRNTTGYCSTYTTLEPEADAFWPQGPRGVREAGLRTKNRVPAPCSLRPT